MVNMQRFRSCLTQRMCYPRCTGEVTVRFDMLKEGDYAGICALQQNFGLVAATKRGNRYYVVMIAQNKTGVKEWETVEIPGNKITLKIEADFERMKDEAYFYYKDNDDWKSIGIAHKLCFSLKHFTGNRFGLFVYATQETGGKAGFENFRYGE